MCPKEKASPVSVSDHDMTINKNTQVVTVTFAWSFFEVDEKNDIVSDGKFALFAAHGLQIREKNSVGWKLKQC